MRIILLVVVLIAIFILGIAVGDICVSKITKKRYENGKKLSYYYHLFNQWLRLRQNGYTLTEYIKEQGICKVAIYGIAELGQRLFDELVQAGITVEYIIDNNPMAYFYNYKIVSMKDSLPPVDAIIVTPILAYDQIKEELGRKVNCPIISLEMLIYNARKKKS